MTILLCWNIQFSLKVDALFSIKMEIDSIDCKQKGSLRIYKRFKFYRSRKNTLNLIKYLLSVSVGIQEI